ncbi:ammonium transporter [Dyella nitratireducens]|uniref:Ammonium transporter n=1 Tax=Dyella nitratireducens TaxID=1849580 RepID=A0ABQ1FTQ3_9GAMM|nr:ammonium transporter [Dyella nitratireducens]GGA29348.1 hypothetical protein GCM10010981_17810 [Dyella nitratireducens]GLQ43154.1 hypothetical protein GCM10007902_30040 [Dyella nitratireducens]
MKKELIGALAWAFVMLVLALGMSVANKLGYIERDTVLRVAVGVIGLWLAWYGNRLPKTFVRSAQGRQAQRVSAWSMVLSGLVYAGLWAFAPIPVATWGGVSAVLLGIVVTLGYCLSLPPKLKAH